MEHFEDDNQNKEEMHLDTQEAETIKEQTGQSSVDRQQTEQETSSNYHYIFEAEDIAAGRKMKEQPRETKPKKRGLMIACAVAGFLIIAGGCFGTIVAINSHNSKNGVIEQSQEVASEEAELNVIPPSEDVKKVATTELEAIKMTSMDTVSDVVNKTLPCIVSIQSTSNQQYSWYGQTFSKEAVASGTGFIVGQNEEGLLIATNNHVVSGAIKIEVTFQDETVAGAVIKGTDSIADIAVLCVDLSSLSEDTKASIQVADIGSSNDIKVGEMAIAIGNALGYGQSVTVGYVSAKNRTLEVSNSSSTGSKKMELLQTDAAINPGNSGGPLLNAAGQVIGINTVKYSSTDVEGMGYAIPISKALPIIQELMTREVLTEDEQGYLGVSGRTITEDVSEYFNMPIGVYVVEISKGGSAEKAGLIAGDIITKINGIEISDINQMKEKVNSIRVGKTVSVTYMRAMDGEYVETTVEVTLMKKPSDDKASDEATAEQGTAMPENGFSKDEGSQGTYPQDGFPQSGFPQSGIEDFFPQR